MIVAIPPQASKCGFGGGGETSVQRYRNTRNAIRA
jgi:hypothetical protein